jgi:methyl-accepting chemotaxis protein
MAEGDMGVRLNLERSDEIGMLAGSFTAMAKHTQNQAQALHQLAEGDLSMQIAVRSESDYVNAALSRMLDKLNALLEEVQESSRYVSSGANQIADGLQSLAEGAGRQTTTLQQLSASVADVLHQSEANTRQAQQAHQAISQAGGLTRNGMDTMNRLTQAMQAINASAARIAEVIAAVDGIAFQTNILALNAAVEAARAGAHGKGFAVVADEVRNLASKSAQAAKETAGIVRDTLDKVAEGTGLAGQTQAALKEVEAITAANADGMARISDASELQRQAISEITLRMEELSGVVQANSATAEESAAAAEEMSSRAQVLNSAAARFHLRKNAAALPPAPPNGHHMLR